MLIKREENDARARVTTLRCLAEFPVEVCGDSGDVNERGLRRQEGAPREKSRANVPLGPSWCCPPGVAVAVEAEEVADVVIWNAERVAVGVFPVLPPSALLSRGARGVAAPWWGSPPTKSAKVLRRFIVIEKEKSNNTK